MAQIIISYQLKDNVTPEQFEQWVRSTDYPTMQGLKRVNNFTTHRAMRNLLSDAKPSVDYVEVFDIPDLEGFLNEDMGGDVVQKIMGEFMQYVENPEFLIAEAVV